MNFVRALATTSAGVWLGGMILMAIVAQTTFSVMRTTGVQHPNAIAGQVMAKNFTRFDKLQMICAGILIVAQIAQMLNGATHWRDWARLALIVAASGLLAYSVRVLTPQIVNLQNAVAAADPDAAVKAVFDRFHETAVLISKINLVLVLAIALDFAWGLRGAARAVTP